jgi:tetratricopeptide (TPR) repeat protein
MKQFWTLAVALSLGVPAVADTYLVLPFFNASRTANLDWIGESISETLLETLATQGLMTLDREGRQEAYRRLGLRIDANLTRATVVKVAQALDADHVIYGQFEFTPAPTGSSGSRGSLRIAANVMDLQVLKQGPQFSEIGALEDLASLQSHLAWQAIRSIAPATAPSEDEYLRTRQQVRVDAIENYIRGLLAPTPEQKLKLFGQAARLEPSFSPASFQLGKLAFARKDYKPAAEWFAKVATTDPRYHEATFFLGIARYETGDYARAQAAFETVVTTVPLNEVYNNLGAAQSRQHLTGALDTFAKALEGDPADPVYHFNVGYALWKSGNFDAAAERFRAVLDRDPKDAEATRLLGKCLKRAGPDTSDRTERFERIKTTYEEGAYWQLKAVLQPEKK